METYLYGDRSASTILLQPVDDHDLEGMEREVSLIQSTAADFGLIALRVDNWNDDLSPWPAPAVFGRDAFGDGAAKTLEEVLRICGDRSRTYFIGGYSLAGLFALWAAYQTDVFAGAAAASPSVWFPGFTDYVRQSDIKTPRVYLSLGDKEEKTKNTVMARVGGCIRKIHTQLGEHGADCVLEWNPGNHFKDPEVRMARAFSWILERSASCS
ncbi:esterase [Selenomonas sp. TAMA-11512]|uniref:esterase n=1 Tax=Selenomonas sp. TAMA-11512 TaxID=3095337 RepID=UPI0030D34086